MYLPYYGPDMESQSQKVCFCYPQIETHEADEEEETKVEAKRKFCAPVDVEDGQNPGECEMMQRFKVALKETEYAKRALTFDSEGRKYGLLNTLFINLFINCFIDFLLNGLLHSVIQGGLTGYFRALIFDSQGPKGPKIR